MQRVLAGVQNELKGILSIYGYRLITSTQLRILSELRHKYTGCMEYIHEKHAERADTHAVALGFN